MQSDKINGHILIDVCYFEIKNSDPKFDSFNSATLS